MKEVYELDIYKLAEELSDMIQVSIIEYQVSSFKFRVWGNEK